jgi:hypothetical protein
LLRTARNFRCGQQPADLLETVCHLLETLANGVFHRAGIL